MRSQRSNLNWVFSAASENTNASQQAEEQIRFNIGKKNAFSPFCGLIGFFGFSVKVSASGSDPDCGVFNSSD